jgi:D-alanyl-D-alanine carboxypeptidase
MPLPFHSISRPAVLAGQNNGELPATLLSDVPGQRGGPTVRLARPADRAWTALCAAALTAGHTLQATGRTDSYRPLEAQEDLFRERYTTTPLADRPSKIWKGQRWYQRPNTAEAAVPGTSNHGWALAVDTTNSESATDDLDTETLAWLVANEEQFGFSHELQSEVWHIHYFAGDAIPAKVLAHEQGEDDMTPEQARQLANWDATHSAMLADKDTVNLLLVNGQRQDFPLPWLQRLKALERNAAQSTAVDAAELAAALAPHIEAIVRRVLSEGDTGRP